MKLIISAQQRRLFSLSNKNDSMTQNQLPEMQQPSGDTARFQPDPAYVSPAAQPRRRRSDKYKTAAKAELPDLVAEETVPSQELPPVAEETQLFKPLTVREETAEPAPRSNELPQAVPPAAVPAVHEAAQAPEAESEPMPQWTQRTPEDAELDYDYSPRPRTVVNPDFDNEDMSAMPFWRKPLIWGIAGALVIVALALFFLLGPVSPFKPAPAQTDLPATSKQAAEVLEFKSPSATGLTNKQIQLHMTTSTNVTGVKLVDGEGQEIPSTADSINADDETIRIWTIGVLFSQPFDGELYAAVCENDVWTTTDKKISLTISEATVQTQAPVEEATTEPTQAPTQEPTKEPTQEPTLEPTPEATDAPTQAPTQVPASIVMSEATVEPTQEPTQEPTEVPTQAPTQEPTEVPTQEPTPEPTQAPTPTPEPLTASSMEGTEPGEIGLKETVFIGSESQKDYSRENVYAAPAPDQYAYNNETGVYTFRGDNFRRNAAFGTAEVTDGQMDVLWSYELGSLRTNDSGTLYGVGWNNQPAIIKWTKEVREMMNLNEEAKAVTGLREVIFSAQDGHVYFLNLTTGEETRAPIKIGYPLRGSVSVDVLGRPMISFGQAISKLPNKTGNIGYYLYNLIDQTELHFINGRSSSSQKQYGSNGAFDGSSLFIYHNGKTAMLVGGENGLFYTLDLNAEFTFPTAENPDAQSALNVNPETTYIRHIAENQAEGRTTIESAIAMYSHYAFVADGYGVIRCIDTNTMQSVWAVDAGDNTDAAIALDDADGTIALYTGNTAYNRLGSKKDVTIRRLDAMTGEEAWQYTLKCDYNKSEQSGVKASPVVGQNDLENLVYFTVNMVENGGSKLLALDKNTGELVWEMNMDAESISSPVAVYNEAGNGWIVQCDSDGNVHLIDGLTGYVNSTTNLGGKIEASPAVYRDMLVVGTCSKDNHMMYCLKIH